MDFRTWINRQYLQWQIDQGERLTISAFARWLGVPQTVISFYLNGKATPRGKNLIAIGKHLPEVYEAVGLPYWRSVVLGDDMAQIKDLFTLLPEDGREAAIQAVKDALSTAVDYEDWRGFVALLTSYQQRHENL